MKISITKEDIKYAEKILLPKGENFDTERCDFIKNLDTIDLQAVPGSGKTTALLAKLLIMERYMPFGNGSGILVISHTNAAVDEIKNKIGNYCPKLFTYPNFVGTIQSFVDQFLAIPFYVNKYKKKPYRIDNEIYNEKIDKFILKPWLYKFNYNDDTFKKVQYISKSTPAKFYEFRFDLDQGKVILTNSLNKTELEVKKPQGRTKKGNYQDYSQNEKDEIYQWFKQFKDYLLKDEKTLHFDDAFFLANLYIQKFPLIKKLLQKRFRFVFVDEMQDMAKHQYDILEKLFFTKKVLRHCYQRIGDKNQAIYSGEVKLDDIWNESYRKKLCLKGSHRLTPEVAKVVQYFGLHYQEIEGLRQSCDIKPHIIVFDNPEDVLPQFVEIIKKEELKDDKNPFCAVGWAGDYKYKDREKTNPDKSKLTIKCYYENFEKKHHKSKIDYLSLKDYLKFYDKKDKSLAPIRKSILNAFVKILRIENKKDENDRNYTVRKLMNFLKENNEEKYQEFKLKLFEWSFSLKKGDEIYDELKNYIQSFFSEIFSDISFSQTTNDFINSREPSGDGNTHIEVLSKNPNVFEDQGIKIKVGTVHSVKGETHTATLYMESFYKSGRGNYESQRLIDQLKGSKKVVDTIDAIKTSKKFVKQSAKMAYVGFSRPTHLLCFAVHKDRFDASFDNYNWNIIQLN